jgi:hypothetical protein
MSLERKICNVILAASMMRDHLLDTVHDMAAMLNAEGGHST